MNVDNLPECRDGCNDSDFDAERLPDAVTQDRRDIVLHVNTADMLALFATIQPGNSVCHHRAYSMQLSMLGRHAYHS